MRFRKKSVVIDAVQWNYESGCDDIIEWIETSGAHAYRDAAIDGGVGPDGEDWGSFEIASLEGDMEVSPFDWIIRGVAGEFYPCKPDIFAQTYEQVANED